MSSTSISAGKWIAFVLACLLFQEAVLRFFFPLPEARPFNRSLYMPSLGGRMDYKAIRSIDLVWTSQPDGVSFVSSLNYYGFRDVDWKVEREEGAARVAFVGDSFTEGLMAPDEQTIPRGFAAAAREDGVKMEAMNFGLGGAGIRQYLPLLLDMVALFRPDKVVLVLFSNDISEGCDELPRAPVVNEEWPRWKPRLVELVGMLRRGECLPARYHYLTRPFFRPIPSPGNPWNDYLRRIEMVARPDIVRAVKAGLFAPMRVCSAMYLKEELLAHFDLSPVLSQVKSYCDSCSCGLYVVYIPDRSLVTDYYKKFDAAIYPPEDLAVDFTAKRYHRHRKALAGQCADAGTPFLDLTGWVSGREAEGRHLYWNYEDHMRGESYLDIGRLVYEWIYSSHCSNR